MAIKISSIDDLKTHMTGVMSRADHHALNVKEIIPTLVGLIVWKANNIDARQYNGSSANMIWFTVDSGNKYAIIYNHTNSFIEIKKDSMNGPIVFTINNSTVISNLLKFFETL